ncbi:MAG TPA: FtsX-like permease family protein [Alphaproteobacteria bacterium]|nr:FtsX-like permease family protein [Alphaproteobacteria bacterium]
MNKMIVANLVHRPIRSVISIFAVAVEVTLILLIVGLALGILDDNKARQRGIGADVMVRPPGSSNLAAFSGAPAPIGVAKILLKQPHVVAVAPVVTQVTSTTNIEVIYGIDPVTFQEVGGPFHFLQGHGFEKPDDMIVDDIFATGSKVHVGDMVEVLNNRFQVAGIVPHGRGARRYIQLSTMQDLVGAPNKASMFYVRLDNPTNGDAVAAEFRKIPGMENYNILSLSEWLTATSVENIPGLSIFIRVVIGIAVIIGFIVIFQSMYTAVMERTREIGILKSLGASKLYIVRVILRETLLLAVAGILVGILVSELARAGIVHKFPTLRVLPLTWGWVIRATLIAVGGAMLGAIYPAFKAAQKDPIDALAYE